MNEELSPIVKAAGSWLKINWINELHPHANDKRIAYSLCMSVFILAFSLQLKDVGSSCTVSWIKLAGEGKWREYIWYLLYSWSGLILYWASGCDGHVCNCIWWTIEYGAAKITFSQEKLYCMFLVLRILQKQKIRNNNLPFTWLEKNGTRQQQHGSFCFATIVEHYLR